MRTQDCDDFDNAIAEAERKADGKAAKSGELAIWNKIRQEAAKDAAAEPLLSSFLYASILSHDTFERSLAFVLANRLADVTLMATELFEVFHSILKADKHVRDAALADLVAVKERDPSCLTYSAALLYFKGYHAIQAYRIAHTLWCRGQKVLALALQSRVSQVFAVDIHPAARIGKGILLDHGTGVVIGETAVVGNNVSIMQNVTLGGTGKDTGDRHPKIGDNVLISACATILGNITVGKGAQVAAGSLVLKQVPKHTMVAGSPAKEVGKVPWNPAINMEHWIQPSQEPFCKDWESAVGSQLKSSHASSSTAPGGTEAGAEGKAVGARAGAGGSDGAATEEGRECSSAQGGAHAAAAAAGDVTGARQQKVAVGSSGAPIEKQVPQTLEAEDDYPDYTI